MQTSKQPRAFAPLSARARRFGSKMDGAAAPCAVEVLESRQMLSAAPVATMGRRGALSVLGGRHADVITVAPAGRHGRMIQVTVDGRASSFRASGVRTISIAAGRGNDEVTVSPALSVRSALDGGEGDDTIDGGGGNDLITGDSGRDQMDGGAGNDNLDGGFDGDTLAGGAGDDTLTGDDGNDYLNGGRGDDAEWGSAGDDFLQGDGGGDWLDGGAGTDHVGFFGGDLSDGLAFDDLPADVQDGLYDLAGGTEVGGYVDVFYDDGAPYYGMAVDVGDSVVEIAVDEFGNRCDCGGDFFYGDATLLSIDQVPYYPRQAILDEAGGDAIGLVQEYRAADGTFLYATIATDDFGDDRDIVVDEEGYSLTDPGGNSYPFDFGSNMGIAATARPASARQDLEAVLG